MTCGLSGSGKSTLAKTITRHLPNFTRLSIDAHIHQTHGLYKIDYPADKYGDYQDEARAAITTELKTLLARGERDVVLDLSFWNKAYREEYKTLIEGAGARWVLVFLDAGREVLWERVTKRREKRDALDEKDKGRDGDSAFDVDGDVFEMYLAGFERPDGEGEVVVPVI